MPTFIRWQKSSFSGGAQDNDCVEVGRSSAGVHLRESDTPDDVIPVSRAALDGLIRGVKAGDLELRCTGPGRRLTQG